MARRPKGWGEDGDGHVCKPNHALQLLMVTKETMRIVMTNDGWEELVMKECPERPNPNHVDRSDCNVLCSSPQDQHSNYVFFNMLDLKITKDKGHTTMLFIDFKQTKDKEPKNVTNSDINPRIYYVSRKN